MYFFIGLSNFVYLFIDVITFDMIFEMCVWFFPVRYRPTKVVVLIFLFVLNSNVATEVPIIVKVKYDFVVNIEILHLSTIDMVVELYLL